MKEKLLEVMAFEKVHEFTIQGQYFYIWWKPGGCLLRTIESGGGGHYTVADLFNDLYDGSSDYELTAEEAIEKAPVIAEGMVTELRKKEVLLMEDLYGSQEKQAQHPVYKVTEINIDKQDDNYPMVWASHNASIYIRIQDEWYYVDFAKSLDEALSKARDFIISKVALRSEKPVTGDNSVYWVNLLKLYAHLFPYVGDWKVQDGTIIHQLPAEIFSDQYLVFEVPYQKEKDIIAGYTYFFFKKNEYNTYGVITVSDWDQEKAYQVVLSISQEIAVIYNNSHSNNNLDVRDVNIVPDDKLEDLKDKHDLVGGQLNWAFLMLDNDFIFEIFCGFVEKDGKSRPPKRPSLLMAIDKGLLDYLIEIDNKTNNDGQSLLMSVLDKGVSCVRV